MAEKSVEQQKIEQVLINIKDNSKDEILELINYKYDPADEIGVGGLKTKFKL